VHQVGFHYTDLRKNMYPPEPSRFVYRQCNIQQSYVLSTQYILVFCLDLRTNSNYFAIRH